MHNDPKLEKFEMEMIAQCRAYSREQVDYVYIYGCCEGRVISANCFFQKGNTVYRMHTLDAVDPAIDVSRRSMSDLLHGLVNVIKDMKAFCQTHDVPMPKEMKLIHEIRSNVTSSEVAFTDQFDYENDIFCSSIFDKWYDAVKAETEV